MLHIAGTSHHYQFGAGVRFGPDHCTEADERAFVELLHNLAHSCAAEVFAEELNQQALAEVGKTSSVMQLVAATLKLPHLFCEPDRAERTALKIMDENEIRFSVFPKRLDEAVVQARAAESWRRREQEWLQRLVIAKSKNVVFVCGANHISTFVPLAQAEGFECKVVHAHWQP
jgi:hypothetical protein